MKTEEKKLFEPSFKFPFPRGVEILMRIFFVVAVMFIIDYVGLLREPSMNYSDTKRLLFVWGMLALWFYAYKLMVNPTVTNKVVIDYAARTFTVNYSLFYFISQKKKISFDDISFWIHHAQILLFGNGIAVFIYETDKFRLKINARNGWKKEQVYEIIDELNKITEGKMRRKPKGIPDEEL